MTEIFTHSTSAKPIPDLAELLVLLHATGLQLTQQKSVLLHTWGLHLLEDWRSLELLAEKYRHEGS